MAAVPALARDVSISEVCAILTNPEQTQPQPVTFRGVVNLVTAGNRGVVLQQGEAGLGVLVPEAFALPAPGREIEVTAEARFTSADPDTTIAAQTIRELGVPGLPPPLRASNAELLSGRFNRRFVEVNAWVLQARQFEGALQVQIADATGAILAHVYEAPPTLLATLSHGARVRFRGCNLGRGEKALRGTGEGVLTVLEPGVADPFATPEGRAEMLVASAVSSGERVRLRGRILGWGPTFFYVRTGETPWRADFIYPFRDYEASKAPLLVPPVPYFKLGDEVEVIGSPLCSGADLRLRFAAMRVLGHGERPAPRTVPVASVVDGAAANDRVTVTARFLGRELAHARDRFVETLRLDAGGGQAVQAVFLSPDGRAFGDLRTDDRIEVAGLVTPTGGSPAFVLTISERGEVRSLGLDSSALWIRLLRIGGVVVTILGAAGLWIVSLRRQIASRTAALAAANARLAAEIEERKRAEAEVGRALEAERELGELKTRFVSLVSHEFRTPLGVTMSAVELLRHYADRLPPEKRSELHNDIHAATLRMSELMEQVLVLGRVEAGRIVLKRTPLEIPDLCHRLADEMHSATSGKSRIEAHAEGDLSGATGDESLLRHIFGNLLSNAVKYSPADSVVTFAVKREDDTAVFTVRDRGIGIPEAARPRLFEAFHRADNVGEIPGTGLGLLIVKRCVDMHAGAIAVDSVIGEGTTFTVRLPLFAR